MRPFHYYRLSETVILHSYRGTQYTAKEYKAFLRTHGIVRSVSGVVNCCDNDVAERFLGLLKRERMNRRRYETRVKPEPRSLITLNSSLIASDGIPTRKGCHQGLPQPLQTLN
ncbi:MAG: DDE-type integrase/transposase/recombinase [Nitrospirales bacterium]|nr:DDE-type integrase/transposase/recombinase [Nitrospirales bacterium]